MANGKAKPNSIRTFRLSDETFNLLVQNRGDKPWDIYLRGLIEERLAEELPLKQIRAQANRLGRTPGQIIRFLSAMSILDEMHFHYFDREMEEVLKRLIAMAENNESEQKIILGALKNDEHNRFRKTGQAY